MLLLLLQHFKLGAYTPLRKINGVGRVSCIQHTQTIGLYIWMVIKIIGCYRKTQSNDDKFIKDVLVTYTSVNDI